MKDEIVKSSSNSINLNRINIKLKKNRDEIINKYISTLQVDTQIGDVTSPLTSNIRSLQENGNINALITEYSEILPEINFTNQLRSLYKAQPIYQLDKKKSLEEPIIFFPL